MACRTAMIGHEASCGDPDLRHDGWAELLEDDDHGGCMVPVLMLYHEHDPNPAMRPEPISAEQREKVIEHMAAGLVGAYRYFRQRGSSGASNRATESHNSKTKIGRNDLCPCGSGKKQGRLLRCSGHTQRRARV